jgi:peptidoglycan/xylan/chitin deacetylase (PgdA/CDA1 family)
MKKTKVAFRFDIDTYKCLTEGTHNLAKMAESQNVNFTFFCNFGRAIERVRSFRELWSDESRETALHLSARRKLGTWGYVTTIVRNPRNKRYLAYLAELVDGGHEIGLHGGRNHANWARCQHTWGLDYLLDEVTWGLRCLSAVDPSQQRFGFASPEWRSPPFLEDVLRELNFFYLADSHGVGWRHDPSSGLINIGTRGAIEPGGVAFFENCLARGLSARTAAHNLLENISASPEDLYVVYDHPYFAGREGLDYVSTALNRVLESGFEVVTIREYLSQHAGKST